MEFRTKREALDRATLLEDKADDAEGRALWSRGRNREHEESAARQWKAEAARIRALLPTLLE